MKKVKEMLDEKCNEIFLALQSENGIKSGDVAPLDFLEYEKSLESLANVINKIIKSQKEGVF